MADDKQDASESVGQDSKKKPYVPPDESGAKEEVSPLGEDVVPAFYIVYNTKHKNFGVIGAPGFLQDRVRTYGALRMAEKQLDDYYAKLDKAQRSIIARVSNFDAKQAFSRFIRRK